MYWKQNKHNSHCPLWLGIPYKKVYEIILACGNIHLIDALTASVHAYVYQNDRGNFMATTSQKFLNEYGFYVEILGFGNSKEKALEDLFGKLYDHIFNVQNKHNKDTLLTIEIMP